jgi:hypothetical protein
VIGREEGEAKQCFYFLLYLVREYPHYLCCFKHRLGACRFPRSCMETRVVLLSQRRPKAWFWAFRLEPQPITTLAHPSWATDQITCSNGSVHDKIIIKGKYINMGNVYALLRISSTNLL